MDGLFETEFKWKLETGVEIAVMAEGEVFRDFQGTHCGDVRLSYDFDAKWISDIVMKQVWEEEYKIGERAVELLYDESEGTRPDDATADYWVDRNREEAWEAS